MGAGSRGKGLWDPPQLCLPSPARPSAPSVGRCRPADCPVLPPRPPAGQMKGFSLLAGPRDFWVDNATALAVPMLQGTGTFQHWSDAQSNVSLTCVPLSARVGLLLVQPHAAGALPALEALAFQHRLQAWTKNLAPRYGCGAGGTGGGGTSWGGGGACSVGEPPDPGPLRRAIRLTMPQLALRAAYDLQDLLAHAKLATLLGAEASLGRISDDHLRVGQVAAAPGVGGGGFSVEGGAGPGGEEAWPGGCAQVGGDGTSALWACAEAGGACHPAHPLPVALPRLARPGLAPPGPCSRVQPGKLGSSWLLGYDRGLRAQAGCPVLRAKGSLPGLASEPSVEGQEPSVLNTWGHTWPVGLRG